MRLLIAEKPHIYTTLRDLDLIPPDTEVTFTYGAGLWRYSLTKPSFKDIPFTEKPTSLRPQGFMWRRLLIDKSGQTIIMLTEASTPDDLLQALNDLVTHLNQNMANYDEIILAVDPGRSGYGAANQLLEQLSEPLPPINSINLNTLERDQLIKKWNARSESPFMVGSKMHDLACRQKAKQTFDYWWNTNSSVVLSELCKWSGLKADPIVSKYELMLIAIMAQKGELIHEWDIHETMWKWPGTGKYSDRKTAKIGSAMSRDAIIVNALSRGAIERHGKNLKISDEGATFVAGLHPKTFDPDLPFRIDSWIEADDYNAMERYIRTVFGRQLRFQRNKVAAKQESIGYPKT